MTTNLSYFESSLFWVFMDFFFLTFFRYEYGNTLLAAVRSNFLTVTADLCLISHQSKNVFTVLHLHLSGSLKFELETIPRQI